MNDINKTKSELIAELKTLRRQVQKMEREKKKSAHEKERFLKTHCIFQDITEQKRAEEELRENVKKLTTVFNGINDAIAIHDLEGHIFEVNNALCERLGYSHEELLQMTPEDIDTEDNAALVKGRIKLLQEQGSITFESVHVRKNGTTLPVEVNSQIIELSGTKAVLSVARDITERKETEKALRESEERYSTMVNSSPNLVFVHKNGIIHYINEFGLRMMGYQKDEIIGRSMFDFISDDSKELAVKNMQRRLAGEHVENYEVKAFTKSQDIKYFLVSASIIPYEQGKAFLAVLSDITERRETANRLEQYRERLSDLASQLALIGENDRRRFADELHDVTGQNLALARIKLEEIRVTISDMNIQSRLEELSQIINEAVVSTRSLTFELSPPILYELGFESAAEWLGEQILKKYNIAFHFEDDRQPKSITDDMKVLLYLSLRELLVNIAKHAKARNATLSIRKKGDSVHIMAADDGNGFDATDIDYQIMKAKSFGLFSTRERIERLGGRLEVKSQPGQGTIVTMIVPLK